MSTGIIINEYNFIGGSFTNPIFLYLLTITIARISTLLISCRFLSSITNRLNLSKNDTELGLSKGGVKCGDRSF